MACIYTASFTQKLINQLVKDVIDIKGPTIFIERENFHGADQSKVTLQERFKNT